MDKVNITLIEIQNLAKTIYDVANNITDIEFDSRGKGSFCMLVSTLIFSHIIIVIHIYFII